MGKCPFCKSKVDEDLVLFGGPCPNCFNQIPGEEAATNPGERVLEAEAKAIQQSSSKRAMIMGAVAVVLLGAAGVAGGLYWEQRNAEQEKIDELLAFQVPDTTDMFSVSDDEWAALMPEEEVEAPQVAKVRPTSTNSGSERAPEAATPDRLKVDDGGVIEHAKMAPGPAPSEAGGIKIAGVGTSFKSRDMVVKGDEIPQMVGSMTKRRGKQIKTCYEQSLKTNDSLVLTFSLLFNVTPDGNTERVRVQHQGQGDAAFDACVARTVGGWTYLKIEKTSEFAFPYRMRPGF